jgi:hypothetical protein
MHPYVAAAARNNAEWCDLVCRSRGLPTAFRGDAWRVRRRSPPYHPDAVTLAPHVLPEAVMDGIDTSPGCSIKDSFATLDLVPYGFEILFDATWIHRPPIAAPVAPRWHRTTHPDAPDHPSVMVFAGPGGRVFANRSTTVVGLSNLTADPGEPIDPVWTDATAAIGAAFPAVPIVGYERAAELPPALRAGFTPVGPLRVWIKP